MANLVESFDGKGTKFCSSHPQLPELPSIVDSKMWRLRSFDEVPSRNYSDKFKSKLYANKTRKRFRRRRTSCCYSIRSSSRHICCHRDTDRHSFGPSLIWRRHSSHTHDLQKTPRRVAKALGSRRKSLLTVSGENQRSLLSRTNYPVCAYLDSRVYSDRCNTVSLRVPDEGELKSLDVSIRLSSRSNPEAENIGWTSPVPILVASEGLVDTGLSLSGSHIQEASESAPDVAGAPLRQSRWSSGMAEKCYFFNDKKPQLKSIDDKEDWLRLKPPSKPPLRFPVGLVDNYLSLGHSLSPLPRSSDHSLYPLPRLFGVAICTADKCVSADCTVDEKTLSVDVDCLSSTQHSCFAASLHVHELVKKGNLSLKSKGLEKEQVPLCSCIGGPSFRQVGKEGKISCPDSHSHSLFASDCGGSQSCTSDLRTIQSHFGSVYERTSTMKPQHTSKAHVGLPTKQTRGASVLAGKAKALATPVAHTNGYPAFSDESSETEYTSSDPSGEVPSSEHDNSVESKPREAPGYQAGSFQSPHKSSKIAHANLAKVHTGGGTKVGNSRKETVVRPSGTCALEDNTYTTNSKGTSKLIKWSEVVSGVGQSAAGVSSAGASAVRALKEQTISRPSIGTPRVVWTSTTNKERYEEDANGNMRVVVDLDDSDEEDLEKPTFSLIKERSPLCSNCHALQRGVRQKGNQKKEVHTPKVTLVVDLSEGPQHVNQSQTVAGATTLLSNGGTSVDVPTCVSVKADGKQKVGMKQEISVEQLETVTESSRKLHSGSALSPTVREKTSPTVRKLNLAEKDEEPMTRRRGARKEESDDEASTLSGNYKRKHGEERDLDVILPDWSPEVVCDLCERGASLSLGAWYSWCCGAPARGCKCSHEEQLRKKVSLKWKGGKKWRKSDPMYPWSGKVHRLCALWSCEVYEAEGAMGMMSLMSAVQRSRKIKCSDADCGLFGATLGCRVKRCKKNYHYPCADRLSVSLKVRMWDGLRLPVACKEHRDINEVCELKPKKKRKRGGKGGSKGKDTEEALPSENKNDGMESGDWKRSKSAGGGVQQMPNVRENFDGFGTYKQGVKTSTGADVIDIFSSEEEQSPHGFTASGRVSHSSTPDITGPGIASMGEMPDSWPEPLNSIPGYLGKKLLCADFSGGLEPIVVPCTNDVDDEAPPYLEYITKSRYQGLPLGSRGCSHPFLKRPAKACKGCAQYDPDDPSAPLSVHIPFQRREDDDREDWQKERMHGRLPYDRYARLIIGTDYNELVECNDRCGCGDSCINREMQMGLRTPIELYKTINKGWAVRTLVPIPRGRFVIEYVGEMLTQDQAHEFGQLYDEIKRSYLYDLDYPESKRKPVFTLDGFHASNVARFINHSCDANLKIFRVYVETTNKWLSHIGMYAMRDIEAGEELSYDYNYGKTHDPHLHDTDNKNHVAGEHQSQTFSEEQENDSRHIKCYCGARNCRKWLWRPLFTDSDSEDESEEGEERNNGR